MKEEQETSAGGWFCRPDPVRRLASAIPSTYASLVTSGLTPGPVSGPHFLDRGRLNLIFQCGPAQVRVFSSLGRETGVSQNAAGTYFRFSRLRPS